MTNRDSKSYACIHSTCAFRTTKRKAIYTHLLRTHAERKEDFECEYCSTIFHDENEIERHLTNEHSSEPFTYTCVSRIEHVISKCAKLGSERRRSHTPSQTAETNKDVEQQDFKSFLVENWLNGAVKVKHENELQTEGLDDDTLEDLKPRTKASVNASLNNIAKTVKITTPDNIKKEPVDHNEDEVSYETEESGQVTSQPTGLKIKLNLRKIAECTSSREASVSPPLLERHVTSPDVAMDSPDCASTLPPDITYNKPNTNVSIREKASKYYDRLEVYHTTDEHGLRCCPFCPYKTSKNTIRVHLSGIHKIHFVKCSLCDYKAAFPHQITQHGVKFHKTTNLNVIQLSKESREKTISKLQKGTGIIKSEHYLSERGVNQTEPIIENDRSNYSFIDDVISNGSYSSSEEEDNSASMMEDRLFKAPKSQTAKTDYYSIQMENGKYMFCCNICTFKTPVRATIYTHKYRHEPKSYKCGYCEFVSFPRSNVAHHCRSKHKNQPVSVLDVVDAPVDDHSDQKQSGVRHDNDKIILQPSDVKQEPIDDTLGSEKSSHNTNALGHQMSGETFKVKTVCVNRPINIPQATKTSPTIIKVPEYKRSFIPVVSNPNQKNQDSKKRKTANQSQGGYKLSINKLYRFNPLGSPKYMCAKCPYACDTHPKMKHHLYRHRPQKYKCPYCEHRKYPRSYVVRHVRDTHRGKPLRVIDLSKGSQSFDDEDFTDDITDYVGNMDENENFDQEINTGIDMEEALSLSMQQTMDQYAANNSSASTNASSAETDTKATVKQEPMESDELNGHLNDTSDAGNHLTVKPTADRLLADRLKLNLSNDLSDKMFSETPDVSPNFSETVYTSTPLIESIINNGQFPASPKSAPKNFERKKSLKDYRINFGEGLRYSCNKCNYGTDNYKTIHNHMYRHESQRYQCPYCGYRRSPRSFVENHIREVHKGNPVIVTELTENLGLDIPAGNHVAHCNKTCVCLLAIMAVKGRMENEGSPRQCVNFKRKEPSTPHTTASSVKRLKGNNSDRTASKMHVKWPAPKPAARVNISTQQSSAASLKQEATSPNKGPSSGPSSPSTVEESQSGSTCETNTNSHSPGLRFKEASRVTFKTMYKCVFDPETCNHISKDKSKMKQHLFMHVEYKPWTCDFCDMTASQSSHIKNHVRSEHRGVSDMSFKYKKHNYLEKHIDGFLAKSLFTVPVNEYRRIMDMKGFTKTVQRPAFKRDVEGFVVCPYCDYKTKGGVMNDHVKTKHMQARFKCHWCEYRAFYRSEVRKHHRKEKSHLNLEFKTLELDLSQVLNRNDLPEEIQCNFDAENSCPTDEDVDRTVGDEAQLDYTVDNNSSADCTDSDCDMSSNSSSIDDINDVDKGEESSVDLKCATDSFLHDSDNKLRKSEPVQAVPDMKTENLAGTPYIEVVEECIMKHTTSNRQNTEKLQNKFSCGHCSFAASLRVKVKMHCSKKHPGSDVSVVEPNAVKGTARTTTRDENIHLGVGEHITRVDANDWKGTKFEHDLRRAGVSKLNLASLFPRAKKIRSDEGTVINSGENNRSEDEKGSQDEGTHVERFDTDTIKSVRNHSIVKSSSPQKSDVRLTGSLKCSNEPEFKVPKAPSPILRTTDKTKKVKPTDSDRTMPTRKDINQQRSYKTYEKEIAQVGFEQMNGTSPDVFNSHNIKFEPNDSFASIDKTDIIVEPLDTEHGRFCLESDYSINQGDAVFEQNLHKAEDICNTHSAQQDENIKIKEESVDKTEMEPTDGEVIILKTFPNLTPVVLELEESPEYETNKSAP